MSPAVIRCSFSATAMAKSWVKVTNWPLECARRCRRRRSVPCRWFWPPHRWLPGGRLPHMADATIRRRIRVDLRPSPVAGQQLDLFLGISGGFAPCSNLFFSTFNIVDSLFKGRTRNRTGCSSCCSAENRKYPYLSRTWRGHSNCGTRGPLLCIDGCCPDCR
jgi:hypothetical protein